MLAQDFGNGVALQVQEQKRDAGLEQMNSMRGSMMVKELSGK